MRAISPIAVCFLLAGCGLDSPRDVRFEESSWGETTTRWRLIGSSSVEVEWLAGAGKSKRYDVRQIDLSQESQAKFRRAFDHVAETESLADRCDSPGLTDAPLIMLRWKEGFRHHEVIGSQTCASGPKAERFIALQELRVLIARAARKAPVISHRGIEPPPKVEIPDEPPPPAGVED